MHTLNEINKIYQRPWGTYQTIALTDNHQVKLVTVNPNSGTSLQQHKYRAEHWVVIAGQPTVTVGENTKVHKVNEAIFIPLGEVHRLANYTQEPVVIVEVQIGSYLGEDDIVRIEDMYGRTL
jgi:mannose-6-phosphate isomerase